MTGRGAAVLRAATSRPRPIGPRRGCGSPLSRKLPPGLLARISAEQRGAHERTGSLLSALGHDVAERDPAYGLVAARVRADLGARHLRAVAARPRPVAAGAQHAADGGRRALRLVPPWRRSATARRRRAATTARILALWDEFDVLVTPGTARTAIARRGRATDARRRLAVDFAGASPRSRPLFNLTGQPAITLPAGIGDDGLPLSVQLVGRIGAEDVLYSLAGQIESAAPWADRRPAAGHRALRRSSHPCTKAARVPSPAGSRCPSLLAVAACSGHVRVRGQRQGRVAVQAGAAPGSVHARPLDDGLLADTAEAARHPSPGGASNPKIDCFYVYPTVSDQKTVNANLHIDPVERSIALYQAARYSQYCRVFAPMYRQVTLTALLAGDTESPGAAQAPGQRCAHRLQAPTWPSTTTAAGSSSSATRRARSCLRS